ncbi:MAG: rhodanese-like domain-containing protein [Nitriliruptorales bacterium]|nr:rhodanese-like domain-containing protein [Nitriliruptorales bacterium]
MRGTHHMTLAEMLAHARSRLQRLTPTEAYAAAERGAWLVDIRTRDQLRRDGRIPQAREVSLNVLEWRLAPDSPARRIDAPGLHDEVIVLCAQGFSSSLAAGRLQDLGFTRATDVIDGFEGWVREGLPVHR